MKRLLTGIIIATAVLASASSAEAMPRYEAPCFASGCGGVSDDGERAVFTFDEPLSDSWSPEDQVYERYRGKTRPLVRFPKGKKEPVRLEGVSDDAKKIVVRTRSPLSADDVDGNGDDIFAIENGEATLVSSDPANPDNSLAPPDIDDPSAKTMNYEGMSADGSTVYLSTFSTAGGSFCTEFFARTSSELKKLSIDCNYTRLLGVSRDGGSVFSLSYDTNKEGLYRTRNGATSLLTDFGVYVLGNCTINTDYGDVSGDGNILLFSTNAQLTAADTDQGYDVYSRDNAGAFKLISEGTKGTNPSCVPGTELDTAVGLSRDGTKALFTTTSPLSADDRDTATDLYRYEPGKPAELITTGPTDDQSNQRNPIYGDALAGMAVRWQRSDASDDLEVVAFDSAQRLVAADTDNSNDVYVRANGETQLVSTGPTSRNEEINAKLLGVSGDGSEVAFTTVESLVGVDTDDHMDVYKRSVTGIDRPTPTPPVPRLRPPTRRARFSSRPSRSPRK
ncbi:MAG: hypothetical protein IPK93_10550 [Solirubrobacterales bacterium]|nr:hypothetical protein [Solirubrobacterales bacterium]